MSKIVRGIEERIKEAMAEGEFDNLPGKGKPLNLDEYFQTPEELRMCYSILKNANVVPEEVEMLKEVETLREELKACSDAERKERLSREIRDKSLKLALALERYKRKS